MCVRVCVSVAGQVDASHTLRVPVGLSGAALAARDERTQDFRAGWLLLLLL